MLSGINSDIQINHQAKVGVGPPDRRIQAFWIVSRPSQCPRRTDAGSAGCGTHAAKAVNAVCSYLLSMNFVQTQDRDRTEIAGDSRCTVFVSGDVCDSRAGRAAP